MSVSPMPRFHLPSLGVGILVLVLFAEGSGLIPLSAMFSEMQAPSQTVRPGSLFVKKVGEMSPSPQPGADPEQLGAGAGGDLWAGSTAQRAASPSRPPSLRAASRSLAQRLGGAFPNLPRPGCVPVHHASHLLCQLGLSSSFQLPFETYLISFFLFFLHFLLNLLE